jgi:hypothetical protein
MSHDDFLPEEYVEHRQDRRTQIIGLALFGIVVTAVAVAFAVKQADWNKVSAIRDQIAIRYDEAGAQVEAIASLEARQQRIHDRASIAAGLVERLPRSVLLAEFINRMPAGLGLLEFDLHTRVVNPPKGPTPIGRGARAQRNEVDEPDVLDIPKYRTDITLLGFAPTDLQVSAFLSALNAHGLIQHVVLQFSEETEMDDQLVRQFRITCSLGPEADIRMLTVEDAPAVQTTSWATMEAPQ